MQMYRAFSLVSGAGLGAGLTYFFDSDGGRRRRVMFADTDHRWSRVAGDITRIAARHIPNGGTGLDAAAKSWVQPTPPVTERMQVDTGVRFPQTEANWSPTARVAAALLGTAAMFYGASRRTVRAATVAASGLGLLVKSMTKQSS